MILLKLLDLIKYLNKLAAKLRQPIFDSRRNFGKRLSIDDSETGEFGQSIVQDLCRQPFGSSLQLAGPRDTGTDLSDDVHGPFATKTFFKNFLSRNVRGIVITFHLVPTSPIGAWLSKRVTDLVFTQRPCVFNDKLLKEYIVSKSAKFYHAGCPVCIAAEQSIVEAIDQNRFDIEIVHLGDSPQRISEAESAGVNSVPALVLGSSVLHINHGANLSALK